MQPFLERILKIRPIGFTAASLGYPYYRKNPSLDRTIRVYMSKEQLADPRTVRKTKRRIIYSRLVYSISSIEYFIYRFYDLNDRGKRRFVGDVERNRIMDRISANGSGELFDDKFLTYQRFAPYYKRAMIRINGAEDREAFDRYLQTHKDIIIKPAGESLGRGVFFADAAAEGFSADELFSRILACAPAIVEDRVHQCGEMAALHPSSVNTVRTLTKVNKDGSVDFIGSFLKVGRGGSRVDNGGQGGLLIAIDSDSGVTTSKGISEALEEYVFHPDTGTQLVGFRIPRWKEAVQLSKELAAGAPEHAVVGWDLALSEDGWVLIEGNSRSMFIGWQTTSGRGWRDVVNRYFQEWL